MLLLPRIAATARQPSPYSKFVFLLVLLLVLGCDRSDDFKNVADPPTPPTLRDEVAQSMNNTPPLSATPSSEASDDDTSTVIDGVQLTVPAGWDNVGPQPGQMGFISGRILIPAAGTQAELIISSTGGGIETNIDRWVGQFDLKADSAPDRTSITIDGREGIWIEIQGTFNARSSGQAGPHANWAVIGIAVPNAEHDFYLKLNGPAVAIEEIRDEFREFAMSAVFGD